MVGSLENKKERKDKSVNTEMEAGLKQSAKPKPKAKAREQKVGSVKLEA